MLGRGWHKYSLYYRESVSGRGGGLMRSPEAQRPDLVKSLNMQIVVTGRLREKSWLSSLASK